MPIDLSSLETVAREVLAALGWETVAIALLLSVACLLAMRRSSSWLVGALLRAAVVLIVFAGTFAAFQIAAQNQQAAERRALEARNADLNLRVLAPGSPLACLDNQSGEAVGTACEAAVFARPETVAASVGYVTARLALLSDGLIFAGRSDPSFVGTLTGTRRAIELDRFGIVAHLLATRDGCTPDDCASFALLNDLTAIKANLKSHAFENYVSRHAEAWKPEEKPAVAAKPAEPAPPGVAAIPAPVPLSSRYDFPTAASIPPVSIMNAEPPRPANDPFVSAKPAEEPAKALPEPEKPAAKLPVPPKRKQNQAAVPPAR